MIRDGLVALTVLYVLVVVFDLVVFGRSLDNYGSIWGLGFMWAVYLVVMMVVWSVRWVRHPWRRALAMIESGCRSGDVAKAERGLALARAYVRAVGEKDRYFADRLAPYEEAVKEMKTRRGVAMISKDAHREA
jgi:hypothetical protein